eukprot:7815383-Prorocentrum_lima.AAC.1
MTSSLVGSEMCIRDRLLSEIESPSGDKYTVTEAMWNEALQCIYVKAVSYTHLTLPTICSV